LPDAVDDTVTDADGVAGAANIINVFTNDTIGANGVTPSDVNLTLASGSSVPPELTFDTTTGNVSLLPGSAIGTYSFDYQICNVIQPDLCEIVTVSITVSGTPVITSNKSVVMFSASEHAILGNDVIYTLSVTNSGTAPVDTDTVFLVDTVPDEIDVYIGDIDDAGPETDPVSFADAASGLTFDYANDVRFFNGATLPTTFTECNYTPSIGYDPNIRYVCFNPKGALSAGDPNPNFSLSFRARIK